ncbi:MAG: S41 family peptidase [Bdellovibrionales bacterium]
MRTLLPLLTFVFLATPISGGVLKVADAQKFWVESGITKDMVSAQISNANCFTSNENLQACRSAISAAKSEIDNPDFQWVDNDFSSVVDQVDQLPLGDKSKEWMFGLLLNTYVRSFDAHGSVLPVAAFEAAIGKDADIHYGAGIKILATDAGVLVRAVTPNSPADSIGLKPFDLLISINGVQVGTGALGYKNTDMIKGHPGDVIDMVIERNGARQKLKLKIGVVAERNVEPEVIAFNGRKYAYIRFLQFKEESCDDLRAKIRALPKAVIGLILDFRDNPGGILEQGICVAGLFVGKKDIVGQKPVPLNFPLQTSYEPPQDNFISWSPSYRSASFPKMPLIILINQNSASAAEVVTGALQDYKQAWVVGDTSSGKGSVQNYEKLDPNFYIGYTTALFYRPNGTTNQLAGVKPNFPVPLRRQASPAERRAPREGDIYTNSLQPLEANMIWSESRPEADLLRHCVESTAVDLTASEMIIKKTGSEDYQKAYALGLFDCSIGSTAQHNSSHGKKVVLNK